MVGTLLLIIANVVVLAAFFFYFRRRIARALESDTIIARVRDEVGQMIVELNETADRNIAVLEERIARLSNLLSDADKRIVVLKKEADKSRAKERVYSQLKPRPAPVEARPPLVDAAPPAAPKSVEPIRPKSLREEVLDLHRQGIEPRTIAARLNKTVGEVELIISLGERAR